MDKNGTKNRIITDFILISFFTILLTVLFLGIYYNFIKSNHTGPMDLWAIILLVAQAVVFLGLIIYIRINKITTHETSNNKFIAISQKIFEFIMKILFYIILIPFMAVYFLILLFMPTVKSNFKFLKKYGFKLVKTKNEYVYHKDNLAFKIIKDDEYSITYDYAKSNIFTALYLTEIGSRKDREELFEVMEGYKNTHPVDKQKGDAPNTMFLHAEFIKKNIAEIINFKETND